MKKMNLEDIQELIKFVAKSGATEVDLEIDNIKISINRQKKCCFCTCEDNFSTDEYKEDNPGLDHSVDETREQLRLVGAELTVGQHQPLYSYLISLLIILASN